MLLKHAIIGLFTDGLFVNLSVPCFGWHKEAAFGFFGRVQACIWIRVGFVPSKAMAKIRDPSNLDFFLQEGISIFFRSFLDSISVDYIAWSWITSEGIMCTWWHLCTGGGTVIAHDQTAFSSLMSPSTHIISSGDPWLREIIHGNRVLWLAIISLTCINDKQCYFKIGIWIHIQRKLII